MTNIRTAHTIDPASPHVGGRVDRLVQELTGWSRAQVTGLFDHDCVQVNGIGAKEPGQRLAVGDVVALAYDNSRKYHPVPRGHRHPGFEVVYEDADLIVVLKPEDLLTVPTRRGETNTLADRVHEYVRHVRGGRGGFVVHRLDRGVSGLLIFGKSREIAGAIKDQFADHKPQRKYVALVAGHLQENEGTFRSLLATDPALNRFSTDDEDIGQEAVTHFRVLERLKFPKAPEATLVEVQLETGRRHQIRVHFAEAGHPVLGDPRYGEELAHHPHWPSRRIALHAQSLGLTHPTTGEELFFSTQWPAEFTQFVNAAKHQAGQPGGSLRSTPATPKSRPPRRKRS